MTIDLLLFCIDHHITYWVYSGRCITGLLCADYIVLIDDNKGVNSKLELLDRYFRVYRLQVRMSFVKF